ncbi:MAG: SDR family NAD(P)-dependent oxidoreductase [Actinomycetota bacterium]|nr:SDR family NAD(P)-dependent oxidoreductase [Actinomycetota bacterium]
MVKSHIALVTGASRGLGREIAIGLARDGYRVLAVARSKSALDSLVEDHPGSIFAYEADVSDNKTVEQLAKRVKKEQGTIQVLVNAAGVFGPIDLIQNSDPEQWAKTILIDTLAPYFTTRVFLAGMLEKRWGRIINLSSAASLHPPGSLNSAYGTAKVALNQFTRHLAAEISGSGVTANVIHPGDVKTQMWADIKEKALALGETGKDYTSWVDWVAETGGDDSKKAMELVLEIVSSSYDLINGRFLWIREPLQAPIASWEDPVDARPWK